MSPDQECRENRLRQEVKDTVEDSLRIWSNDISTFAEAPCDWVECPDGEGPDTSHQKCAMNVSTEGLCVLATCDSKLIEDCQHSETPESVEAELISCLDESADETGNDHDFVEEDNIRDGWPWKSSCQHQVEKEKWCGDDPIDVSGVEDGAIDACNDWIIADELDIDRCPAQIATHGEVGDAGGHVECSGEVKEDSVRPWFSGCCCHDGDCSETPLMYC